MFHPRASVRGPAAALAVVFCVAGCATMHSGPVSQGANPPLTASLSLSPAEEHRAEAHAEYATGLSAELRGDFDEALAHYQRVLELDPHYTALIPHVVQIYSAKHDTASAVRVLESGITANPKDPELGQDLWR